jgi:hypothetical protein
METVFSVFKVPRQCPLLLLVRVKLVFRIQNFNVNGVGGGCIGAKFSLTLGGLH